MRHRPLAVLVAATTAAAVLVAPPPASAATSIAVTGRVSVSTTGKNGGANADDQLPQVSSDGRFVAFTAVEPLVAGDVDGNQDVFVRDRMGGSTERVSLWATATEIPGATQLCGMSRDGRYVGFVGIGAPLPQPSTFHLYLRDRKERTTSLVSVNTSGDPADAGGGSAGIFGGDPCPISDDGRYVAFVSTAANLAGGDENGTGPDIFRRDRTIGATERVSLSNTELGGTAASFEPAMSGNGDAIAFTSSAPNLVANDTNGTTDVFLRKIAAGTTTRVSVTTGGAQLLASSDAPAITADGTKVAFVSGAPNLVANDSNGFDDVFVRTLAGGAVVRASFAVGGGQLQTDADRPDLSDDGQVVTFTGWFSDDQPGDTNHDDDVYVHRFATGQTELVSRTPAGVAGDGQSYEHALSADGSTIAFNSDSSDLVRDDGNGAVPDVFVRSIASIAPFTSVAAFVKQQFVDFEGRVPTAAEATEWAARIANGERTPDELIDDLAHGATWSAKRAPLARLYWAFFLRPPDSGGMTYWTNQLAGGKKLAQVAAQFAASSEFQTKYGSLSNQAFVTKIYQNIFQRDPDAGGLAYWTNKLDTKQKTRGDVMVNFSESSEGKRRLAPQTDTVLIYLGMLRTMPTFAITLEGIAAIRDAGYPAEIVAESLREQPGYVARVDVDG